MGSLVQRRLHRRSTGQAVCNGRGWTIGLGGGEVDSEQLCLRARPVWDKPQTSKQYQYTGFIVACPVVRIMVSPRQALKQLPAHPPTPEQRRYPLGCHCNALAGRPKPAEGAAPSLLQLGFLSLTYSSLLGHPHSCTVRVCSRLRPLASPQALSSQRREGTHFPARLFSKHHRTPLFPSPPRSSHHDLSTQGLAHSPTINPAYLTPDGRCDIRYFGATDFTACRPFSLFLTVPASLPFPWPSVGCVGVRPSRSCRYDRLIAPQRLDGVVQLQI